MEAETRAYNIGFDRGKAVGFREALDYLLESVPGLKSQFDGQFKMMIKAPLEEAQPITEGVKFTMFEPKATIYHAQKYYVTVIIEPKKEHYATWETVKELREG